MSAIFWLQGRNVVIFYGSQTGTAEEFAGRLAKDASRYGMKAIVADPEESDMVLVVFSIFFLINFYICCFYLCIAVHCCAYLNMSVLSTSG